MQHLATYPLSFVFDGPRFACGAAATGARNHRLEADPAATTCQPCKDTVAGLENQGGAA